MQRQRQLHDAQIRGKMAVVLRDDVNDQPANLGGKTRKLFWLQPLNVFG